MKIKAVSELFNSLVIFCVCDSDKPSAFVITPAGLPVNFSFVMSQLDKDEIFYSYYIILSKH
ncbi:hypothetical protein WIS35_14240 [Clostridioides difficile]|uniref:hypothetical protein n=1 Tax=Clostridioides difficile TaxID=1496 RepID=UPI000A48E48E|nr:hypothetical protein [Clostridioides difficile]